MNYTNSSLQHTLEELQQEQNENTTDHIASVLSKLGPYEHITSFEDKPRVLGVERLGRW